MAELMVDLITSLDGYASRRAGPAGGAWKGPSTWAGWRRTSPRSGHLALMGATTYRLMSQMSTAAARGAGRLPPEEADSLSGLDALSKVSSRRP